MRDPLQESKADVYDRPNQPWVCGLSAEGQLCPVGPGSRGRCPGAAACHPIREGDRWVCNRSKSRGGPCETGPSPDGTCCQVYECTPLRSLRARRGRFVVGCVLATLGGLILLLSTSSRNNWLAPGELSVQHAQLLSRGRDTQRCASCHAAGSQTFVQWMQHAVNAELSSPSQSVLCMECHKNTISSNHALSAHSLDVSVLMASSDPSAWRRLDPTQDLACATCHQEHHGMAHDLAWMSDHACQACHQQQYESFATDHPDFADWPVARRTRIAFDHGSHQLKHFPKERQEFDCASCHVQDREGDFQRTLGYETTCAKCHDSKIEASWDAGVSMFSLPMIDDEVLRSVGRDIGQWPEQALGEFDGALPPITKLLLAADQRAATAMLVLGSDFDFFDVDPDDAKQLQAAGEIVWATKRLLYDMTVRGQDAIRERVETVLDRQLSKSQFADLTSRLSPDNLRVVTDSWLTKLSAELENRGGLGLQSQPASGGDATERDMALQRVAAGGWLSDDPTLSIRYRPTGHADSWMTAWIDVMAEATVGPHSQITKPLLKQLMTPTAAGQCGSCHSLDRQADGSCVVQWYSRRRSDEVAPFTKFSHQPHLTQSELADCQGCHQINALANVMATYSATAATEYENGFQPLTKQSCAECHTPGAAGDSCLQCHNYHVGAD
ncbi:MAG: hypothetical protein AAGD11_00035 [Planctomycetota bacterium]